MIKLSLFCFLLIYLPLSGFTQSQLLSQKISLQSKQVTIEEVLNQITQRYQIPFSYSQDVILLGQKVSVQAKNQALQEVLQQLFAGTGIEFVLMGEQVVLKKAAAVQELGVIRGKVADIHTKEPLAFASVQISGKAIGTTTLASGDFALKISPQYIRDTLIISYMGYAPVIKPVGALLNQTVQIELTPETRELGEVVVQSITGLSILQQAMAKIHENYDTAAFNLSFFLREWVFHDGGPIRVSEAVYEGYRGSLQENTTRQVKLINSRNKKYYQEYQGILLAFPHLTGYEVFMNRTAVFDDVSALYKHKKDFPVPGGHQYHDFVWSGTGKIHDKEVYIIDFDQKDAYRHKALYKGRLYIDVASMAIIKSVIDFSPKGIKNVRFFNSPKAAALLLGFGKCAVTKNQVTFTYKEHQGKWYVDSLQTIYETHLVKDKWDFDSFVYYRGDFVVTEVKKDNPLPFDKSDEAGNLQLHQEQDDRHFWQNYSAVKPDPDFELAFQQIDSLNKLHPYQDEFWKRYKMYKQPQVTSISNPSTATSVQSPHLSDNLLIPLNEKKETKHFRFIYSAIDTSSIEEIAENLEDNYSRIVTDLEVRQQPRVEVTIYPSIQAYHLAINNPDAPLTDVGSAVSNKAFRIVSPNNPGPVWNYEFMMKAFIHEFTHCVHYTILEGITTKSLVTLSETDSQGSWLFESLACYEAGQFFHPSKFKYLTQGDYPALEELGESGKVYDIGYVLIDYIKTTWGTKNLNHLIRTNGNIQASLGLSETEFERKFYDYVKDKYMQ
jgi:hypothetical protein